VYFNYIDIGNIINQQMNRMVFATHFLLTILCLHFVDQEELPMRDLLHHVFLKKFSAPGGLDGKNFMG
jgi:hypothetical protein